MSFGLIDANKLDAPETPPTSIGTPSITISGSLLTNEEPPLSLIVEPEPGAPPLVVI